MKIAIIGTGVMGRGWITQCAINGDDVHCYDSNTESLLGTIPFCEKLAGRVAKKEKIESGSFVSDAMGKIHTYEQRETFIEAAKKCDVFFEIVFEDLDLKRSLLSEIVPQLPDSVLVWSNTSGLDINLLAEASGRPAQAIVVHGMNPVPLMPGVELVPGTKTSAATVDFTREVLQKMNKAAFVGPNIPGFWVNRLLIPQMLDAIRLLEQGKIEVADGDIGLNSCLSHPQGTFKLADFISTPTLLRVAMEMYLATNDPRLYPPRILVRMVKDSEHGITSKKGFYDWSDQRNPQPRDFSKDIVTSVDQLLK